jgi:hypothetical protein
MLHSLEHHELQLLQGYVAPLRAEVPLLKLKVKDIVAVRLSFQHLYMQLVQIGVRQSLPVSVVCSSSSLQQQSVLL